MFTCVVVDDEKLSRERITSFVEQQPGWQVIAEAAEFTEAQRVICRNRPDLCFLDINIIGGSGVELAAGLSETVSSAVVFTTAYQEYALRAFEINATDYLLKPFEDKRLHAVLQKVEKAHKTPAFTTYKTLAVKSIGEVHFINIDDIIWIKGASNYVELHCKDRMLLHRETLNHLEQQLDPNKFVRAHRSALVNVAEVNALTSELGRYTLLQMSNGEEVKIGPAHKQGLFGHLGVGQV